MKSNKIWMGKKPGWIEEQMLGGHKKRDGEKDRKLEKLNKNLQIPN